METTKGELSGMLIKAVKRDNLEAQEAFVNAFIKHCIDNNLFETSADVEDAQMGVKIIGQGIIIESIHALDHTQLAKADAIVYKVVDAIPKLMDAANRLKTAVKAKREKSVKRGIKL